MNYIDNIHFVREVHKYIYTCVYIVTKYDNFPSEEIILLYVCKGNSIYSELYMTIFILRGKSMYSKNIKKLYLYTEVLDIHKFKSI